MSALLTATVSLSLAFVFVLVVILVRQQALNRRFQELRGAVQQVGREWSPAEGLGEAREDNPGVEIAVYSPNGRLIASTGKRTPVFFVGARKVGDSLTYGFQTDNVVIVGESSWLETEAGIVQLAWVLAALWVPLTLLTAGVAWYGGGLVLRPVAELVTSAERLSGTGGPGRLSTTDKAEFATLVQSLNQLIDRVQSVATLQEQFASDAAHELRTPLALLQTRIEANLLRERTPEEHVAAQKALLRQIDRLTSIVESLLATARQTNVETSESSFSDSLVAAVDDWLDLTQWPNERLRLTVESCCASVPRDEVAIIVRNLLDNAARHAPDETVIEVSLTSTEKAILMTVRDYGSGLTAQAMAHAFERFYRTDEERGREGGGAGIGLAVVRRIVESHGGTVRFFPVESGALIQVQLPERGQSSHSSG